MLRYEVNDGQKVFFWSDNWLGLGRLIDVTGELGTRYLGINATLAEETNEEGWSLRRRGSRVYPQVYDAIATIPYPDSEVGPDKVLWTNGPEKFKKKFSSSYTWDTIRPKK